MSAERGPGRPEKLRGRRSMAEGAGGREQPAAGRGPAEEDAEPWPEPACPDTPAAAAGRRRERRSGVSALGAAERLPSSLGPAAAEPEASLLEAARATPRRSSIIKVRRRRAGARTCPQPAPCGSPRRRGARESRPGCERAWLGAEPVGAALGSPLGARAERGAGAATRWAARTSCRQQFCSAAARDLRSAQSFPAAERSSGEGEDLGRGLQGAEPHGTGHAQGSPLPRLDCLSHPARGQEQHQPIAAACACCSPSLHVAAMRGCAAHPTLIAAVKRTGQMLTPKTPVL